MAFRRAPTTAARSRTPCLPPSPRPPTFLPPAHYAAAGGFRYPTDKGPRSASIDSESSAESNISHALPRPGDQTESVAKKQSERRFSFISARARTPEPERNTNRESQILNLPLVESQLLPSLRDTIDRMTRLPSRPDPKSPSLTATPASMPAGPSSPRPADHKSRSKLPMKPALKSALKPPTPRLLSPSPRNEPPPPAIRPGVPSLRSVRSLLKRKGSKSTVPTDTEAAPSFDRSRSKTDPGSSTLLSSPALHSTLSSTPQPPRTRPFVSHIPRRARFGDTTEESDIETRYGSSTQRRLFVTNAEALASSSSSASEIEIRMQTPDIVTSPHRFRGLGISHPDLGQHDGEFSVKDSLRARQRQSPYSIVSSIPNHRNNPIDHEELLSDTETHRRRKRELLGIVGGRRNVSTRPQYDDESEYHAGQSLAVSGATELDDMSSESEYDSDEPYPAPPPPPIVYVSEHRSLDRRWPVTAPNTSEGRRSGQYDAVKIALASRYAAAQQRQAFGIPPSESDIEYHGTKGQLQQADSLTSELDNMAKTTWQEASEPDEISQSAQKLFGSLSVSGRQEIRRSEHRDARRKAAHSTPTLTLTPTPMPAPHGRQDIFAKLRQTEALYVETLFHAVRLFVLPLKIQGSKFWIAGVPPVIAKVLDWLEDILNLHTGVLDELNNGQLDSEALLGLPAQMEVYQPYLVRLAAGVEGLRKAMDDPDSDFGEFVHIQQESLGDDGNEGWTLEKLLVQPINRLEQYPQLFKLLLDATPRSSPEYLFTVSLLHSTEAIISAMAEVKFRDDSSSPLSRLRPGNVLRALPPALTPAR